MEILYSGEKEQATAAYNCMREIQKHSVQRKMSQKQELLLNDSTDVKYKSYTV